LSVGKIVAIPQLGGLHHRYERIAHSNFCSDRLLANDSYKIFNSYRQLSDSNAGCMMDCIRDRGSNTGKADFADAAGTKRIQVVIRVIKEGNVDLGAVGVHGYQIVGEAAIDRSAAALIVLILSSSYVVVPQEYFLSTKRSPALLSQRNHRTYHSGIPVKRRDEQVNLARSAPSPNYATSEFQ
jgi:hypothetical protein